MKSVSKPNTIRLALLLIIIAAFFIFGVVYLVTFLKPYSYVNTMAKTETNSATNEMRYMFLLKMTVTTRRALIPDEPIDILVEVGVVDKQWQDAFKQQSPMLHVFDADFVTEKENPFPLPPPKNEAQKMFNELTGSPAFAILKSENGSNIYRGKMKIKCSNPGAHKIGLTFTGIAPVEMPFTLEIGSSMEVMNKKMNDLLLIIAVVTFITTLWTFLRDVFKRDQPPATPSATLQRASRK